MFHSKAHNQKLRRETLNKLSILNKYLKINKLPLHFRQRQSSLNVGAMWIAQHWQPI
jgi:hypothetical protein